MDLEPLVVSDELSERDLARAVGVGGGELLVNQRLVLLAVAREDLRSVRSLISEVRVDYFTKCARADRVFGCDCWVA